ncbi:hypothetical protein [Streptomyces resistomycificus]|uniref:PknH-like extracellular domain-containing protein n=1 Tax=Streptomyces resistomycificus TaxID=67356 RepID=A0A0L8L2S2_9ACTN|nr:hypothetical protein [Streptomyces resistomycificus]KOG32457.1 hypothetical protein ADK37_26660 [Streptomyces resistomycificus]KUO01178.1 hypothetical protein AQJ84_01610 [Streptomyces resistomycificus]
MPKHIRSGALTVLAITGAMLGTALAVQAEAQPAPVAATKAAQTSTARTDTAVTPTVAAKAVAAPKFLAASELPPHPSSSWTAGKVTDGVPDEMRFCLEEALLAYDSRYRPFHTDLETSAQQLTIVVGSTAKAKALVTRLNKEIRSCAKRAEQADPEIEASYKSYGSLPVEEGAQVHGLHTNASWGATDISLLSVGRDGRTVTVVEWGQMGDFGDAPVKAFKKTTTTAVNKLY